MELPADEKGKDDENGEDADLWSYVTKSVTPLPGREVKAPVKAPPRKSKIIKKQEATAPLLTAQGAPQGNEIDHRTAEKLRRGRFPIEARLDLHGMGRAEAHEALQDFLLRCHAAGMRHVLVITGKGNRNGAPGILRQSVPDWLEDPPLRAVVLRYAFARRGHGGEGALYILLRRRRE